MSEVLSDRMSELEPISDIECQIIFQVKVRIYGR